MQNNYLPNEHKHKHKHKINNITSSEKLNNSDFLIDDIDIYKLYIYYPDHDILIYPSDSNNKHSKTLLHKILHKFCIC